MENRIYLNSFMQKKTEDDDTEFTLELGAPYTFNKIQLDSAIIENQFPTFYESYKEDFTKMLVEYDDGLVLYPSTVTLNQFYQSFDEVVAFFNSVSDLTMVVLP